MAITAIQLDNWAERTLVNGFQMNSMVQLDGAGVPDALAHGRELRVAVFETANFAVHMKYAIDCFQICMALGTGLIAGGGNVDASAVLAMTCHTPEGFCLGFVMDGAIVTGEACAVGCLREKSAGGLQMASRAIFFENGVRRREAAAAVNARVF